MKTKDLGGEFAVGLSSPVLVKNLYLSLDEIDGFFSDNYFDLMPGATRLVRFKPEKTVSAKAIETGLKMMHMAQIA